MMAADLASAFSHETRKSLHMFGVWPVGQKLALGTYGTLEGDLFTALGNVSEFGIAVSPDSVGPKLQFNFKSRNVTQAKVKAKASTKKTSAVGSARVSTKMTFKSAGSTFFRAKDANYQSASNLGAINNAIMDAFASGIWNGEWAFVHGAYLAGGTTIIISNDRNASIELEGTAAANGVLDLADASAGIEGSVSEHIECEILAQPGLTPLICLSKIRPRSRLLALLGWSEKTVRPLLAATEAGSTIEISHNALNKLNPEVSMELAKELKVAPDELFHMVEVDGSLPE